MMTAKETFDAAKRNHGCLGRSASDEPVFVLCARDVLAANIVREWADALEMAAARKGELTARRKEKIADARKLAMAMDDWRGKNGGRVPGGDPWAGTSSQSADAVARADGEVTE